MKSPQRPIDLLYISPVVIRVGQLSHGYRKFGWSVGLEQLLQTHQTFVCLINNCKRFPAPRLHNVNVCLHLPSQQYNWINPKLHKLSMMTHKRQHLRATKRSDVDINSRDNFRDENGSPIGFPDAAPPLCRKYFARDLRCAMIVDRIFRRRRSEANDTLSTPTRRRIVRMKIEKINL